MSCKHNLRQDWTGYSTAGFIFSLSLRCRFCSTMQTLAGSRPILPGKAQKLRLCAYHRFNIKYTRFLHSL